MHPIVLTKIKHITLILTFSFCTQFVFGQSDPAALNIAAKAVYYDHNVIIRWTPMDWETWRWGNVEGYRLERYTYSINDEPLTISQLESSFVLLASQLKPVSEDDFKVMAETSDLAGVAAGCIYGDSLDIVLPGEINLLTIYQKSLETENRFAFSLFAADQELPVAEAMGLAFVDNTAEVGYEYIYRIKPYDPPVSTIVQNGFIKISIDTSLVLSKPLGLQGVGADSMVMLQWQHDKSVYSSYLVERSREDLIFSVMNSSPIIASAKPDDLSGILEATFVDSLPSNEVNYIYRVRGVTPFGMIGPYSDTIQITGKPDPIYVLMSVQSVEEDSLGNLLVTWDFPSNQESDITGFDVYRSANQAGPFSKLTTTLLGVTVRTFLDTEPEPLNFYQVKATDIHGYPLETFPLVGQLNDDTPPSVPVILTGSSDPAGVAKITWQRNPESDVMGYRVYLSTVQSGDFAQVTSVWVNDTVFRYQLNLNTLNDTVYFGVTALDYHHNQSEMSTPKVVLRPDIIAPSAPLITSARPTTIGVQLTWVGSSSLDVVAYEFQRKTAGLPGWEVLANFTPQTMIYDFYDSTASNKRWYQYRLVAIDEAGNKGGSIVVRAKPLYNGLRGPLKNLELQGPGGISPVPYALFEWDYLKDVDLIGFQIYRGFDSTKMISFKFFPMPPPAQQGSLPEFVVTSNGLYEHFEFYDIDMDFDVKLQTTYSYIHATGLNTNYAIPPQTTNPTVGSTVTYSPTNPNQHPVNASTINLWYWVMAKFADGTTSPVAGPLMITF